LALADIGENGCSNKKFQTLFNGRKTPGVHWAFAVMELVTGLVLIGAAIVSILPRGKIPILEKETTLTTTLTEG